MYTCVYQLTVTAPGMMLAPILIFSASISFCVAGFLAAARGDFRRGEVGGFFFFVAFAVILMAGCGGEGRYGSSLSSSSTGSNATGFFGWRAVFLPLGEDGSFARGGVFFFWTGSSLSTSSDTRR